MKRIVVTGLILLGAPAVAMAACTGNTRQNFNQLVGLLPGKYVCSKHGGNDWQWQELHVGAAGSTSGDLLDYKKGPTDKVDPSKVVGTWAITQQGNTARVTYNYTAFGSAGPYAHTVHSNGNGTYSFCGQGNQEVVATLQTGTTGCH
jgi:hypothetical protein